MGKIGGNMGISKEAKSLAFTFFLSVLGGGMGVLLISKAGLLKAPAKTIPPPHVLNIKPEALIGDPSAPHKPYVLVEFMDYQCPPCRKTETFLPKILSPYDGKLRFTVRNFPLSFHPYAMPSALVAESAREQGRFWPVHDALITLQPLTTAAIDSIPKKQGLDLIRYGRVHSQAANKYVKEDLQIAQQLHLPGTPSFVLCCPDNRVVKLSSLDQLKTFVK